MRSFDMAATRAATLPPKAPPVASDFLAGLTDILGGPNVVTEHEQRVFFSTDIAKRGVTAEAVIRPTSIEALAEAVGYCTRNGRYVIPRGGGFSYTEGYIPVREPTIMVDLRGLNRVVEINTEDMYVTVECGCTWKALYEALKEKGFRTPYFGPMSGFGSTVGGALSQGSFFLGSTEYGTTAETTLGLEIVLADGSILKTGSAGSNVSPSPFFRTYGPDLTGPFLGDTGALGFKARATLKLIPVPQHQAFGAFPFETMEQSIRMVSEVGRLGLASECYCWDPAFVKSIGQRTTTLQNVRFLAGVVGSGPTLFSGLKQAAKIAAAGKRVFDGSAYLVNVAIDDVSAAGAEEKLKLVRAIAAKHGGGEIEATAPRTTRGTPFTDFNSGGALRNIPTNGLCPHSKAQALAAEVHALFADRKAVMDAHGITVSVIFFAVGNNALCIEPLFFWDDHEHRLHDRVKQTSDLAGLSAFSGRPPATTTAMQLRDELVEIFRRNGCVHVQIGKSYPYRQTRQPATYGLLQAIKRAVDPGGYVNPESLGLD
jgi:FAD/FMN-containing dehydrogenase